VFAFISYIYPSCNPQPKIPHPFIANPLRLYGRSSNLLFMKVKITFYYFLFFVYRICTMLHRRLHRLRHDHCTSYRRHFVAKGFNFNGTAGTGNTVQQPNYIQIGTDTTGAKTCIGDTHALAVKNDGTLWVWGKNTNGLLRVWLSS
jgi:hypothetical protein